MKYALFSLSDKEGALSLAQVLSENGYQLLATGGTASHLKSNNLPVTLIEELTKFPEILDGRVKTLHPKVFGGILADRDNRGHLQQLKEFSFDLIDIVVVNLYPFRKLLNELTSAENRVSHETMIENIDIGGVALLRAAAKNHQHVCVISDKSDYGKVLREIGQNGSISPETRKNLARKAFALTSSYDRLIHQYLNRVDGAADNATSLFPDWQKTELRYGENPHQQASFFFPGENGLTEQLHGKQLSYNNYLDINSSLKLITRFDRPTIAIFKHTNPCGVASSDNLFSAYRKCLATDPLSPFGGIVIMNHPPDIPLLEEVDQIFTEIIIAPDYSEEVLTFLRKKKNRRIIRYQPQYLKEWAKTKTFLSCLDGILCQDIDLTEDERENWRVVTKKAPTEKELLSLRFAWKVVTSLKSNAVCITFEEETIGLGMGQTSRIDAAEIAVYRSEKYGHSLKDTVAASDGFFPFRDGVEYLASQGIKAFIQPGGSKGDDDVIGACDELGVSMIFTGRRHFAHN
jgi:phosphoribosylaminoimidazolecarboxamide formyltransferase/IMP cyclohydrolase